MTPNPIPQQHGCLSILRHRGSMPASNGVTTIGTNDPDVWEHFLWGEGVAYTAMLKCDLPGHRPDLIELSTHFGVHPQVWHAVPARAQTEPQ